MCFGWFEFGFKVLFWFVLFLVGNLPVKKGQMPHFMFQPNTAPPRRRSARLGGGLRLGEGHYA